MAEFIVGRPFRKLARKHPSVARALWYLDYMVVRGIVGLFRALPVDAASRVGSFLGRMIGPQLRKKSQIIGENLAVAFGGLSDSERKRMTSGVWEQAGRVLAEYPHLDTINGDDSRIEIEFRGTSAESLLGSEHLVFVSAHQSNWEVAILAMAKLGIESTTLYSPSSNPFLDHMLRESRGALRCELVPRDNSMRPLMRAMSTGRAAAMVVDRRVDSGADIEFFGHDKKSSVLPARLALKFGCGVTPVQVERQDGARFRVTFHAPIMPQDLQASAEVQAAEMTAHVHRLFEQWIKESPQDWFCSKRLWPKRIMSGF